MYVGRTVFVFRRQLHLPNHHKTVHHSCRAQTCKTKSSIVTQQQFSKGQITNFINRQQQFNWAWGETRIFACTRLSFLFCFWFTILLHKSRHLVCLWIIERLRCALRCCMYYSLVGNSRRFAVHAQPGERPTAEILVVHVVRHVLEILQVRPYQHVAQRDKVAVLKIFH